MRPGDTSPEAWEVYLGLMERMSPEEKLQRTFEFSTMVRNLAQAMLRSEYPLASEREIFLREARQRLGAD
jgi:hypothetical protein